MTDLIGRTVSKVEIQILLGRGGMAEVYLGTHTTLGRPVAVKILLRHLSDDPELLTRFTHEARAVAGLRHPSIVQVFDFDVVDDRPYMVMEYIAGYSLADYLHRLRLAGGSVDPIVAARLISALAAALDTAHAHGIVHRDIKPANVLLRRDGGPFDPSGPLPADVEPVLSDFGVLRMIGANRQTVAGRIFGTPAYMSPEQARGEDVDGRSDIYSLGVLLYELLAGRPPFASEHDTAGSLLIKHITAAPPPLDNVVPGVRAVLDRALGKSREARYQKAGDLADDLRVAVGGAGTIAIAMPAGLPQPAGPPAGRAQISGQGSLDLLKMGEIFQGLDDAFLERVAGLLVAQRVPAGTILFRRGDPGDMLYIVLAGRVKIFTSDAAGAERVLAFNTEGHFFGEMALLTGAPRSASAEAVSDSRLLLLTKAHFDRLLADNPVVQRTMLQVFARRQVEMNRRLFEESSGRLARAEEEGQVFVLFSPKGGAGTSTVAVNLAVALAHQHPGRVALLDLSIPFSHAAVLLNLVPKVSLATAGPDTLKKLDRDSLNDYLVPHSSTLRLLAGALRLEDRDLVTRPHVQAALGLLARYFTYVVVDTASTLSDPVLAAVERADRLVLVATPERTALGDLRECRRLFADVLDVRAERFYYLLNQPGAFPSLERDEFVAALQQRPHAELPFGGALPAAAARRGDAFVVTEPDAPLSRAIEQVAQELAGGVHPAPVSAREPPAGRLAP